MNKEGSDNMQLRSSLLSTKDIFLHCVPQNDSLTFESSLVLLRHCPCLSCQLN